MLKNVAIAALAAVWAAAASGTVLAEQVKGPATPGQGVVQKGTSPKTGKGSGLMEEEGIFYKNKPAGTPKPR